MSTVAASAPAAARGRIFLRPPVLLLLCGIVAGLYMLTHEHAMAFGRAVEMPAIARNLVAHGEFGNPNAPFLTGPTAVNPPLYPLFLALLLKVLGWPGWIMTAAAVNIALNAGCAALMPRVGRLCCGDARPGIIAGCLWIAAMRLIPQWDATATSFLLLVFCLAAARDWERGGPPIASGLLAGAVSLMNPATVLITISWAVFLTIWRRTNARRAFQFMAACGMAIALSNLPWVARNYRIWGAPVARTNFGQTLYTSNNDCALPSLYRNFLNHCYQDTTPTFSVTESRRVAALGEAQYDRARTAEALAWIRSHPARFRELTLARIAQFWFPDPAPAPRAVYAIWLITALSIPGIVLMIRRRAAARWYALALWTIYPPMYYIMVSDNRYRYPILWTSLLPAGYWLASLLPAWRHNR